MVTICGHIEVSACLHSTDQAAAQYDDAIVHVASPILAWLRLSCYEVLVQRCANDLGI